MNAVGKWLPRLVAADFIASILHCGDNMLYFAAYPEPAWITGDVADIAVFLATDAARWVTGQNIGAGGGAF